MSASATVIAQQAQGVTLPNSAVTGSGSLSTVSVLKNGKSVSTPIVVGLRGDSRTQIVSGVSAGTQVVVTTTLPALGTGSSTGSAAGGTGTLGGTRGLGAGGVGGAGFGGAGGFGGGRLRLGGGSGGGGGLAGGGGAGGG
jgi:macrolide-specific efflux system membrane fusion protein